MPFSPHSLLEALLTLVSEAAHPSRYVVGFSGGLDSTALLHGLHTAKTGIPTLAVHVDHGLHGDSALWAEHAAKFAANLDTEFECLRVPVSRTGGRGLEAAARDARYAAIRNLLQPGDWFLSAHHLDDQAETLLLNLLRGSGPLGLAAMRAARPLGAGWLVRPMLDVGRADLLEYAQRAGLCWLDDPSNTDTRFDRNFLRHEILPVLGDRWPEAAASLGRSAELAREAQQLLDDLAAVDFDSVAVGRDRLSISSLSLLGAARQRNLLRFACRRLALPTPPASRLETLLNDLLTSAPDAEPQVCWTGVEVRRYRDDLFILPDNLTAPPSFGGLLCPGERLELGPSLGWLTLEASSGPGIPESMVSKGLRVATRIGGERLRVSSGGRSQKLKTLLQTNGVLPWMRNRLPLLMADDSLVAVADRWINADIAVKPGYRVVWHDQPALT